MWYVIQTQTGREQELTECIERVLKGNGYRACFVIEQECVWRNAGELLAYQKPLFPSYVNSGRSGRKRRNCSAR